MTHYDVTVDLCWQGSKYFMNCPVEYSLFQMFDKVMTWYGFSEEQVLEYEILMINGLPMKIDLNHVMKHSVPYLYVKGMVDKFNGLNEETQGCLIGYQSEIEEYLGEPWFDYFTLPSNRLTLIEAENWDELWDKIMPIPYHATPEEKREKLKLLGFNGELKNSIYMQKQ